MLDLEGCQGSSATLSHLTDRERNKVTRSHGDFSFYVVLVYFLFLKVGLSGEY